MEAFITGNAGHGQMADLKSNDVYDTEFSRSALSATIRGALRISLWNVLNLIIATIV